MVGLVTRTTNAINKNVKRNKLEKVQTSQYYKRERRCQR
jgi:hypothetical protein